MSWEPQEGAVEYSRAFCSIGSLSGGPAGSYGTGGGGSTANVYAPTGQGTADTQSQGLLTSLYDLLPNVQSLTSSYANNPYYGQALTGAQTGAGYGANTASGATDYSNYLYGLGKQTAAPIGSLQQGASQVLQTGFDPQTSLYQKGLQQTSDSANAINSMYGVGSSPYGAGLANDAARSYNLDWQDRQLKRQTDALKAASAGDLSASELGTGASSIGTGAYNQGVGASNLAATSAALPSQAYVANLGDTYTGIKDQSAYGSNLYSDLANYLGLGQNASKTSGQLGSLGSSQNTSALSGLAGLGSLGSNLLLGSGGILGALGLSPETGLLGGLSDMGGGTDYSGYGY